MDDNYRPRLEIPVCRTLDSPQPQPVSQKACGRTRDVGTMPRLYHGRNDRDEAQWVARRISRGNPRGHTAAADSRALPRPLCVAAARGCVHQARHQLCDILGTAFHSRREVKDTIAYLRMLVYGDDLSFLRTFNTPSRRMGTQKPNAIRAPTPRRGAVALQCCKSGGYYPASPARAPKPISTPSRAAANFVSAATDSQAVVERSATRSCFAA